MSLLARLLRWEGIFLVGLLVHSTLFAAVYLVKSYVLEIDIFERGGLHAAGRCLAKSLGPMLETTNKGG